MTRFSSDICLGSFSFAARKPTQAGVCSVLTTGATLGGVTPHCVFSRGFAPSNPRLGFAHFSTLRVRQRGIPFRSRLIMIIAWPSAAKGYSVMPRATRKVAGCRGPRDNHYDDHVAPFDYCVANRKVDIWLHGQGNSTLSWDKAGQPSHLVDVVQ